MIKLTHICGKIRHIISKYLNLYHAYPRIFTLGIILTVSALFCLDNGVGFVPNFLFINFSTQRTIERTRPTLGD